METKELKFPEDFLWGTSTSAYQVEGGITNDWSEWEKSAKRIKKLKQKDLDPDDFICGSACDSYNRYEEDFDLALNLDTNAIRFGFEWSRIEPRYGVWDKKEIEHYANVLWVAKSLGLKIAATIWHLTNPLWISRNGGWANGGSVGKFLEYVKIVTENFGQYIDYWITLNEPIIHVFDGYLTGKFPPSKKYSRDAKKVFNNLALAHNESYKIIHDKYPGSLVGNTNLINYFEPANKNNPIEKFIVNTYDYLWNRAFLEKIINHIDYIGLNYYFHDRIAAWPPFGRNENKKVNDMDWEIYPEGIYHVLKRLSKYNKPIIVTENGLADREDKYRADFIRDHLYHIYRAMEEGVDVRGYFHWSLLDNFEWAAGYAPKFGLYEVDRKTFKRTPRRSALIYAEICKNNKLVI